MLDRYLDLGANLDGKSGSSAMEAWVQPGVLTSPMKPGNRLFLLVFHEILAWGRTRYMTLDVPLFFPFPVVRVCIPRF